MGQTKRGMRALQRSAYYKRSQNGAGRSNEAFPVGAGYFFTINPQDASHKNILSNSDGIHYYFSEAQNNAILHI